MSLAKSLYYGAGSAWARASGRRPVGTNIYEADWDICIVLDSARLDLMRECIEASSLTADVGAVWSRGSITTEWLSQTFRSPNEREIADTTFVSATPHSETVFGRGEWLTNQSDVDVPYPQNPAASAEDFGELHEVWRSHATECGAVPPSVMHDATIQAYRRHGGSVVAHWMQPHEPFLAPDAPVVGGGPTEKNVWDGLPDEYDRGEVWESYRETLSWALEYVGDVLGCVDADVLITSDHGNAFGEAGVYGHPFGWPQPAVRRVPWIETEAVKKHDYEPEDVLGKEDEGGVEEQLRALGYR